MWGVIADKYGRRPALLLGLLGTALSAILFGLAPTFMIAVIARFMWGFLNGNIGVSKTYVAEILDDTNTPRGMAVFGVIGGVGRTIGPVIGKKFP
jgi:MFS family permease